jgi:tetratricopeptide (TPR) repeat protein
MREAPRRLVASYQRLAEIANSSDDPEEAARIVAKAVPHAEAVVRQDPSDTTARLNLSQIYREQAESLGHRARLPEALARMRESRAMVEALVNENPTDTRFTTGLLFALSGEGNLLLRMGEPLAARSVYGRQLDVARQRAARDPHDNTAQIGVAIALRQVGDVTLRAGRFDEARAYLDEGSRLMAACAARDPTNGWALDNLAAVVRLHGEALRLSSSASDRARACPAFTEALRHWNSLKDRNAFPAYSAQAYRLAQSRAADCERRDP